MGEGVGEVGGGGRLGRGGGGGSEGRSFLSAGSPVAFCSSSFPLASPSSPLRDVAPLSSSQTFSSLPTISVTPSSPSISSPCVSSSLPLSPSISSDCPSPLSTSQTFSSLPSSPISLSPPFPAPPPPLPSLFEKQKELSWGYLREVCLKFYFYSVFCDFVVVFVFSFLPDFSIPPSPQPLLHQYVHRKQSDLVQKIISTTKIDINMTDLAGWTPLHLAVKNNDLKMTETLCRGGANMEAETMNGLTPLGLCRLCVLCMFCCVCCV